MTLLSHTHHDRVANIVGVLLDDAPEPVLLEELAVFVVVGVISEVEDDVRPGFGSFSLFDSEAVGTFALPDVCLICTKCSGDYLDALCNHKCAVKSHSELTDDIGILHCLGIFRLELEGAAACNDSEVVF